MTRAALYLRISQDKTGEHLGVDRQREDCIALAKQLDWEIAETYVDNDVSATSSKARPAYTRMLTEIDAGDIDAIIAWHPDRLYRKVTDLTGLVDVCKRNNTQIATARAGSIDLTTPTGRLVAGLLAQVATYEGEAKSDRWRRSWRQGREAGKFAGNGRRTFGYTLDGEVIEPEAAIVRDLADQVLAGKPLLTICRDLDRAGILTTLANPWSPQGLKRLLTNPRIAGWAALDGEIIAEGTWPPLIDRDTWEGVQALLRSRTRAFVPRKALLTRLIQCGACGQPMVTSDAKGNRTYRCPSRPNMPGCGKVSGNARYIEELVESYAQTRLADPAVRKHVAELRAEGDDGPRSELAAIELRLTELEKQLDDPTIPLAAVTRAIERAQEKQAELRGKITARNGVVIPDKDADWPDDLLRRRQLVDLVVADIRLNPATKPSRNGFDPERVVVVDRFG